MLIPPMAFPGCSQIQKMNWLSSFVFSDERFAYVLGFIAKLPCIYINSRNMGRAILLSFLDRYRVMIVCFHYRLQAAVLCPFSNGGKFEEQDK